VGEDHGRARLTNHEVELIRDLHACGMSYLQIAMKFDVSKATVHKIVKLQRRAMVAVEWKTVGCT
jgi:predicted DNA-binding protein (UPF0251 family)